MTNKKFSDLFGQPARKPEKDLLTQFHMDIAASAQAVLEEIFLRLAKSLSAEYKISNICLAGGVALNCVANGKLHKSQLFKDIWIQPAASDAGGALGAALALWYKELNKKRISSNKDSMRGSYLGPQFKQEEIEKNLIDMGAVFEKLTEDKMIEKTAIALSEEKAIGWFQGRMEFGPRALGARSIIADPRSATMQKKLNLKVKYRESFRPFAPSVLNERVYDWFDLNIDSPYMLLVADVKKDIRKEMTDDEKKLFGIEKLNIVRSSIPSVTHVDYSARIQTVHKETNPLYYNLISKFNELTKCPVIINTSFNVRGEPIVCNVVDAFRCFMGTKLDMLVCGNFILEKNKQNPKLYENYKNKYSLD